MTDSKQWYADKMQVTIKQMKEVEYFIEESVKSHEAQLTKRREEQRDHVKHYAYTVEQYNIWADANGMPRYTGKESVDEV